MKKVVFAIVLAIYSLTFAKETSVIKKVEKTYFNTFVYANFSDVRVGMSAIVIRDNGKNSGIVASCEVIEIKDLISKLKCYEFDHLDQDALPKIAFDIKQNDQIILRPLDKRAIIISPNQEKYLDTVKKYNNYEFIHPDLFAQKLMEEDNPFPQKEDLISLAKKFYIGTIIFTFDSETYLVDSLTFTLLDKFVAEKNTNTNIHKPFYNRIGDIKPNVLNIFSSSKIDQFDNYYKMLIKQEQK